MPVYLRRALAATALGAIATVMPAIPATAEDAPPLVDIALFKYGGATSAEGAENFDRFHAILRDKIRVLYARIIERADDATYLANLRVSDPKPKPPASPADYATFWRNLSALQLMTGLLSKQTDGLWLVQSTIYLGELADNTPPLPSAGVVVQLPVSAEEYANIVDSHSLVTLLALALDAERHNSPKNVTAAFIAEATNTLADLQRRTTLSGDLVTLREALKVVATRLMEPSS